MFTIDCPFCDARCSVEPAAFVAPAFSFRCDECSVEVELADAAVQPRLMLAA